MFCAIVRVATRRIHEATRRNLVQSQMFQIPKNTKILENEGFIQSFDSIFKTPSAEEIERVLEKFHKRNWLKQRGYLPRDSMDLRFTETKKLPKPSQPPHSHRAPLVILKDNMVLGRPPERVYDLSLRNKPWPLLPLAPFYRRNGESTLKDAIESILCQTLKRSSC